MTGAPTALAQRPEYTAAGYLHLADPINVAFLKGADSAIAFVAPEPVPEPDSASALGAALLGLVAAPGGTGALPDRPVRPR
jgi:hypothetical protein